MVGLYNANVASADLGVAGEQLADRRVNLYVRGSGGTAAYSFYVDEDNRISDLRDGRHPDADLKMTTDRATVRGIAGADDPSAAFRRAVARGDVVVGGERGRIVERVKWTVINAAKGLLF
ncbi:hypothetical protein [Halegenticoccus soli]|uniref:hypothetical protein n=1 Tax=Halegenticoccus soli TaxID=1985678 RepID=UPI001E4D8094|nr:hypothetical protein [Halegenticoccus soli]